MNYFKTFILLAGMTALFMAIGAAIAGQGGMMIAFVIAVATNIFSYWNSDKIVLKMYKAKEMRSGRLYNLTIPLADGAGMPRPKVYIIENPQPNAFATGRNPENAAVAATTGILDLLDDDELAGVMAHELAHIKNRDTLIMTIAATFAGAIGMLANFAMFFGGRGQNRNPIGAIVMMIIAPMAAMLVQMAISRTREYAADKQGGIISNNPLALASALKKISSYSGRVVNETAERNPATAHMFIINPLMNNRIDNLFSTHPSPVNRIRELSEQAKMMGANKGVQTFDTPWDDDVDK